MVTTDSEIISQGEVESPFQQVNEQHPNNRMLESLGRQSSIYSLTLDEFQNTLCDSGKNFGSMNMDEFLNSIWTAEENQVHTTNTTSTTIPPPLENNTSKGLRKQHSLTRQGSLTVPEPLCRKTVEEVWSEIHNTHHDNNGGQSQSRVPKAAQKQATLGEMTLEDFLVCAGIVREPDFTPAPAQPTYGNFQNANLDHVAPSLMATPVMHGSISTNVSHPQRGVAEGQGYTGGMKRGGGFTPQPLAVNYGGRMGTESGGFGAAQGLGIRTPLSPMLSDVNQLDVGTQYGLDLSGVRSGRKRTNDGPVEKVVERRRRRMIKNRESAARSRARKQAYTVELEAELNQLKEENAHLKQALAEIERKRRQQYYEEARARAHVKTKAEKTNEKLRAMRRTMSCSY